MSCWSGEESRDGGGGQDWKHRRRCHGWIGDPVCEEVAEL